METSHQLTPETGVTPIPISPHVRTVLLLAAVLALVTVVPVPIRELGDLIVAVPELATEAEGGLLRILRPLEERGLLPAEPSTVIADIRQGVLDRVQALAQWLLGSVFGVLTGAVGTFLDLFGVLFIAIYLLADIGRFRAIFIHAAPTRYRRDAQQLWDNLGRSLSRYLSGLLVSLAIQGDALKVHPLLVFLAVVVGGELSGLLGAALAVPVLAMLRVLFDFFAARLYVQQPDQVAADVPIEASNPTVVAHADTDETG